MVWWQGRKSAGPLKTTAEKLIWETHERSERMREKVLLLSLSPARLEDGWRKSDSY